VVVDSRDPVAAPLPAPAAPALGDAVRGQAKPVAPAAPVVLSPAAAPAVRVTAPEATPTAPVVVDNRDPVVVPSPAPALGDAVRGQPVYASLSAGWYWQRAGLNTLADKVASADDSVFESITRRINGGLNGLKDRQALYKRALEVLQ